MEGVTILNTMPEEKHFMPFIIVGVFTLIVSILIFLVDRANALFLIFSVTGLMLLFLGWWISYPERYEVTIDYSVSFNEFQEHYEIIDQKGKIYIVEVRE